MVVVSQWPQKLGYQGRSGTVYPYQSHSNVSWCLIKTDSGHVYGVWCWPGASLRGQKLITHPGTWTSGHHQALRLPQHQAAANVTSKIHEVRIRHQLNHEKTRHVRMGPDGDKLWGWHFMTTETLGDPSHVTCHKLQIIGSSHQAPVTPVTRAWLPGKQPHSNVQKDMNYWMFIFDILSKSPGFGDSELGTRAWQLFQSPKLSDHDIWWEIQGCAVGTRLMAVLWAAKLFLMITAL